LPRATTQCKTYRVKLLGKTYQIIDTPGLDDSPRANLVVLKSIAAEVSKISKQTQTIGGVVYFHKITNLRLTGSDRTNIEVFEQICGRQFLHRAVFATTMWDTVSSADHRKFGQLHTSLEKMYSHLVEKGTKFLKFEGNDISATAVLQSLAKSATNPAPRLQLENEVIKTGLSASSVRKTSAGKVIVKQMNRGSCVIL